MRLWLMALVFGIVPVLVVAQPAVVRSGEHDGFTRVVIDFGSRGAWSLERRDGGYLLSAPTEGYDLSAAFRLIGRDRVSALRPGPSAGDLAIDLACDCGVSSFESGARSLVLDFGEEFARDDVAAPPTASAGTAGPRPVVQETEEVRPLPAAAAAPGPAVIPLPEAAPDARPRRAADVGPGAGILQAPAPAASVLPGAAEPALVSEETPDPVRVPVAQRPTAAPSNEQFTRALVTELARAGAQGLLDPREDLALAAEQARRAASTDESGESPSLAQASIRISTGVDRAHEASARTAEPARTLAACEPASAFDVAGWGRPEDPARQIAEGRRALLGEFDTPDGDAAFALARTYAYLTFGAEAIQVLDTFAADDPEAPILREIATLMDAGPSDFPLLRAQHQCGGFSSLWGFLVGADIQASGIAIEDVLFAFSSLPGHLRRNIAPRLAERLTAIGEADAVDVVVASVERVTEADDPAFVLTQARGPVSAMSPPSEDDGLLKLARTVHPEASTALLLQIEELVSLGAPVPDDLVDTASILSFERAGTADGARLKAAEIDSRSANGDMIRAFDELARAAEARTLVDHLLERSRDRVLVALTDAATDGEVARVAYDPRAEEIFGAAGPDLLNAFAERLLGIGFADRATRFARHSEAPEAALFRSQVALQNGDLAGALDLAEAAGAAADPDYLATLLSLSEKHDTAAEVLRAEGDDRWVEEAWRAGDWRQVADRDDGPRGTAAALMQALSAAGPPPAGEPSLALSTRLIEESAGLRDALGALIGPASEAGS